MEEIEELEDEYQEKKALSTGTTDEATITDTYLYVGEHVTGDRAILRLETTGGESHVVGINLYDPVDREDLITVYTHLEISPENNLQGLVNESVEMSYRREENQFVDDETVVILHCGQRSIETNSYVDFEDENYKKRPISTETWNKFLRAYRYVTLNDVVMSQKIKDISSDEEYVYIDFVESEDQVKLSREVGYDDEPSSPYERLVEYVGTGSVETLIDSNIYVAHLSAVNFNEEKDEYMDDKKERIQHAWDEVVTIEDTPTGNWIISGTKPPTRSDQTQYWYAGGLGVFLFIISLDPLAGSALLRLSGFLIATGAYYFKPYPVLSANS
jgi:hypothetical protein